MAPKAPAIPTAHWHDATMPVSALRHAKQSGQDYRADVFSLSGGGNDAIFRQAIPKPCSRKPDIWSAA